MRQRTKEPCVDPITTTACRSTGKQYALKIVEKQLVLKHKVAHHVQRERRILDAINHPGVVRLHFTFQDSQHIYFGLEPLLNGMPIIYHVHHHYGKNNSS